MAGDSDTELPLEVRRNRMAAVISDQRYMRVQELAARFTVSEVTVRSDLAELERHAQVRRVRGGAVSLERPPGERPFEEMLGDRTDEKRQIGSAAAQLMTSGETLLLDVGTTTAAVARALVARADLTDVTVFTNGLRIALELERVIPRFTVVVTGGTLRPLQHSLVDPLADTILERIHADTVILGCNGIDLDAGITNINLPEAEVKRRMRRAANRTIVVGDGSKIGRVALSPLCAIDELDVLITSASADPQLVEQLRDAGVHVEVVAHRDEVKESARRGRGTVSPSD
jgi:DeoR family transcriptional regulator of aga operon